MQQLQPQLAEFLRTCIHPASLFLRVAQVQHLDLKHDYDVVPAQYDPEHRFATKYVLTDGTLMVQALLHRKLSGLREAANVAVGDFLNIHQSVLKKAPRTHGQGKVLYLLVQDCHFLLQPSGALASETQPLGQRDASKELKRKLESQEVGNLDHLKEQECVRGNSPLKKAKLLDSNPTQILSLQKREDVQKQHDPEILAADSSGLQPIVTAHLRSNPEDSGDEDFFESVTPNPSARLARRRVLHQLDLNSIHALPTCDDLPVTIKEPQAEPPAPTKLELPRDDCLSRDDSSIGPAELPNPSKDAAPSESSTYEENLSVLKSRNGTFSLSHLPPQDSMNQQNPANLNEKQEQGPRVRNRNIIISAPLFHTLGALRNPPRDNPLPTKSYAVTTLAFVSWTGSTLIHRAGSAFPPKRHIKITDPSLFGSRPQSRGGVNVPANGPSFQPQTAFHEAVTLAVYLDAARFKPPVGTLALFRGITMQKLQNGDIILNAYTRLKDQIFEADSATEDLSAEGGEAGLTSHWFITDPDKIRELGYGSKLEYYAEWWKDRTIAMASHSRQTG